MDLIERLQDMSARQPIEFLGGAYYEPIYSLVPKGDLENQVFMMREKIAQLFGQDPQGAWLTERVWDPDLHHAFEAAAIRYTVLDEASLKVAGGKLPNGGYIRSLRQQNHPIDFFISSKALRYAIPFRSPREVVQSLAAQGSTPRLSVFADDLEKFGLWPGTGDWVYKKEWLNRFFSALKSHPGICLETFRSYRERHPAAVHMDMPRSSYGEMMEWSGGDFFNFFDKYSESLYMKERMTHLSHVLSNGASKSLMPEELSRSKVSLYQSQCNCPYWHGVFGGLYLHHLRSSVFNKLIEADKPLGKLGESNLRQEASFERLDFESGVRVRARMPKQTGYFNPGSGGALEELDFLPKSVNILCSLRRRQEPYHEFIMPGLPGTGKLSAIHRILGVRQKGLRKKLHYDQFDKLSFMDHFFANEIGWNEFYTSRYRESGDFVGRPYQWTADGPNLILEREAFVDLRGDKRRFWVRKIFSSDRPGVLTAEYSVTNLSGGLVEAAMGTEFNFSIEDRSVLEGCSREAVREIQFQDSWHSLSVKLKTDRPTGVLVYPVQTVSESEEGMGLTLQGVSVLLQNPLRLDPDESWKQKIELFVAGSDDN